MTISWATLAANLPSGSLSVSANSVTLNFGTLVEAGQISPQAIGSQSIVPGIMALLEGVAITQDAINKKIDAANTATTTTAQIDFIQKTITQAAQIPDPNLSSFTSNDPVNINISYTVNANVGTSGLPNNTLDPSGTTVY